MKRKIREREKGRDRGWKERGKEGRGAEGEGNFSPCNMHELSNAINLVYSYSELL